MDVSRTFLVIIYASVMVVGSGCALTTNRDVGDLEWREWCADAKEEMLGIPAFNASANHVGPAETSQVRSNMQFFELVVPLPEHGFEKSRIRSTQFGATVLSLYSPGLRMAVIAEPRLVILDVFETFRVSLPTNIQNYIHAEYGSTEQFTAQRFPDNLTELSLALEGFEQQVEDLDCQNGTLDEVLVMYPKLLAAVAPPPSLLREKVRRISFGATTVFLGLS